MTQTTGSFGGGFNKTLIEGALKGIAMLHPALGPVVQIVLSHEDEIEGLIPVITAGVEEGPGAFAAAEKAAPDLAKAIRNLVAHAPGEAATHEESAAIIDKHAENFTRHLVGLPAMDENEEKVLLDRATPHNDPSEENSKFGG